MKAVSLIIMIPIRVIVSLVIFAPVMLLLGLLANLGEWLNETCDNLLGMWMNLGKECQYLTNGSQRKQAVEALRENIALKERLRLLSVDPSPGIIHPCKECGEGDLGVPNCICPICGGE